MISDYLIFKCVFIIDYLSPCRYRVDETKSHFAFSKGKLT